MKGHKSPSNVSIKFGSVGQRPGMVFSFYIGNVGIGSYIYGGKERFHKTSYYGIKNT